MSDIIALDELKSCYGLPYGLIGIFSIIPMLIATIEIFLPPINISRLYNINPREYFIFVIMTGIIGIMKVGPVIYTCIRCYGEWVIVLIALGQLTPRGFVILSIIEKNEKKNNEKEDNEWQNISQKPYWQETDSRDRYFDIIKSNITRKIDRYKLFVVLLLTISGWLGIIRFITIHKFNEIITEILIIIPISLFVLICSCNLRIKNEIIAKVTTFFVIMVIVNFHIIGPVIYLGLVTTNYGIASTGAGVASCTIFILGDLIQLFIYYLDFFHDMFKRRVIVATKPHPNPIPTHPNFHNPTQIPNPIPISIPNHKSHPKSHS